MKKKKTTFLTMRTIRLPFRVKTVKIACYDFFKYCKKISDVKFLDISFVLN